MVLRAIVAGILFAVLWGGLQTLRGGGDRPSVWTAVILGIVFAGVPYFLLKRKAKSKERDV